MFRVTAEGYTLAGVFALPSGGVLLGDPEVGNGKGGAFYLIDRHNLPASGAWYAWFKQHDDGGLELVLYHGSVKQPLAWTNEEWFPVPFGSASGSMCIVAAAAFVRTAEWLHSPAEWVAMCRTPNNAPVLVSPFGCFVRASRVVQLAWGRDQEGNVRGMRVRLHGETQ